MEQKVIDPETLTKVSVDSLPEVYKERMESRLSKLKPIKIKYTEEDRLLHETQEGEILATNVRTKEAGGLDLILDPHYDPNKPWATRYATQKTRIIKKNSRDFDKIKTTSIYTKSFIKVHGAIKFEQLKTFKNNIDDVRVKYQEDMNSKDLKVKMLGTMLSMTDESAFRAGNMKSASSKKGTKNYGLTTLKAKHFIKEGDIYKVDFIGKDMVRNIKYIKKAESVKNIDEFLKGKNPEDFVFVVKENGKENRVDEKELNRYVKKLNNVKGGLRFHLFRTMIASKRFEEFIKECEEKGRVPDVPTQDELAKLVKMAGIESSKLLCNTPDACLKNYIVPQLIFDVFKNHGVPVPDTYLEYVSNIPKGVDIGKLAEEGLNKNDDDLDEDEESSNNENVKAMVEEIDDNYFSNLNKKDETSYMKYPILAAIGEYDDDEDDGYINEDALDNIDNMFDEDGNVIMENFVSLFNDEKSTYEEDQKKREEFEDYIMQYEYDEKDLFLDKEVIGTFLVPTNFAPDFSDMILYQRPNYYQDVKRSKDLDIRKDVDKLGYNDFPLGVEKNKEIIEKQAQDDIDNLLKESEDNKCQE